MGRAKDEVIRASLDRLEDDYAVLYSNDAPERRFELPRELIRNAKPGTRLWLHIEGGSVTRVEINSEETQEAKERIHKKYERLRKGLHLG
ncbi:MAG: DUF3006 domain-containing protein [Thermoproteota archaeon]|nr:DUF3006 domain-containing protein [Thermoproteota archaeon]